MRLAKTQDRERRKSALISSVKRNIMQFGNQVSLGSTNQGGSSDVQGRTELLRRRALWAHGRLFGIGGTIESLPA